MVQAERSKELLLQIMRPCFFEFEDWPVELLESASAKNLDVAETVEQMFRFRTLILNFMEMCPYELVDRVYFGQLIASICGGITSMQASTV